jgi:hypothetical protein
MIEIITCDQNSAQWHEARRGLVTASRFKDVLAKGEGKTRRSYMLQLAGELLTGEPHEGFMTADMERGHEMEPDARNMYALMTDASPELVGFIRNGAKGCSPDSLIGDVGMLEIKTKLPHLLIDVLLRDEFPAEHKAQCQGALWVSEREWIDIAVYWPRLPLFIKRAYRDEAYIAGLAAAVDAFNAELADTVERIRSYGVADRLREQLEWLALDKGLI